MSNWIKCSERMPGNTEMVLICTKDKSLYTAFHNSHRNCWDDGDFFSDIHGVTHWQPLPTPPEEE